MKFDFLKKIWGRKKEPEKDKAKETEIIKTEEERHKPSFDIKSGINFKILPLITEKSLKLVKEENKYTFLVYHRKINKVELKKAIERMFNVKVVDIRTMNYRERRRGRTRIPSRRKAFKKIIVQLPKDQIIPVFE